MDLVGPAASFRGLYDWSRYDGRLLTSSKSISQPLFPAAPIIIAGIDSIGGTLLVVALVNNTDCRFE